MIVNLGKMRKKPDKATADDAGKIQRNSKREE